MSEQLQAAIATIVGVVLANWVVIAPVLKKGILVAWEKSIQWRDMVNDIEALKKDIVKLKADVSAAHDKIRKSRPP